MIISEKKDSVVSEKYASLYKFLGFCQKRVARNRRKNAYDPGCFSKAVTYQEKRIIQALAKVV